MAPIADAIFAREDPAKLAAALGIPPNVDPRPILLALPGMMGDAVPIGADRTMTLDAPDQNWFLIVSILCIAFAGIFLMIRVYTKLAIVKSFELADCECFLKSVSLGLNTDMLIDFLFLTFPLILAEVGIGYQMVKWGSGVHQWQVTNDQLFHQLYWANIGQLVYCPLSFFVKMAILVQYLRLFAPSRSVNQAMFFGAWGTIISCTILYTVLIFWTAFYCHPRKAIWDKLTPDAKCSDVNDITLAQGAFNMASDIIILILPTSGLWKLNVPLGRKIAVTLLFATGLLACIASAMRIVFTVKIAPVITEADVSHNALFIGLWTETECTLGFVVACALCLPKLIQAKGKKLKRAMSKASSPFNSLRSGLSNMSRSGTFNLSRGEKSRNNTLNNSRSDTMQITSRKSTQQPQAPNQFVEMNELQQSPPSMSEEFELPHEHRYTHLGPPSSGSSMYSQSMGLNSTSETPAMSRDNSTKTVPKPLHVPKASSSDIHDSIRSPTNRITRDYMSPEQLREEIHTLQAFKFDPILAALAAVEAAPIGDEPTATIMASWVGDESIATVIASGVEATGYYTGYTGYTATVDASAVAEETALVRYRFTPGGNIV
ncbi:uncharacterized protein N0V89_002523 [Didymosphaeria variabile]|uniref:Rhodopsin domain-containing protein n=1 Tax=Didymosphaeria variabile TaxID=1932322 RepID=A0A9W8XS99_9PLEO|nr:uncharacterized protein N0V89_002523 [Didymosphaeria variabile]KAJ4357946.1 hypothetical protein N0V89_002523 [Didymosphaeria variabile]